ncbi:MAG: hypothetical protein HY825_15550 [Acidobacteria bacterium]|nr:hypothetical protein [Acidobacteriota bacterium]
MKATREKKKNARKKSPLLVDMTVPGPDAGPVIDAAGSLRPGLAVLILGGVVLRPETVALRARGIPILRKPFTPDEMGRAIEDALGRHGGGGGGLS